MFNRIKAAFGGTKKAEVAEMYRFMDQFERGLAAWAERYVETGADPAPLDRVGDLMAKARLGRTRLRAVCPWAVEVERLNLEGYALRGRPETLARLSLLWGALTSQPRNAYDPLARFFRDPLWRKKMPDLAADQITDISDVIAALDALGLPEEKLLRSMLVETFRPIEINLPSTATYLEELPNKRLKRLLGNLDAKNHVRVLESMARRGVLARPERVPFLMRRVEDKAATVRKAAAEILAQRHAEAAVPAAVAALDGAPVAVRASLAQLLGEIGSEAAQAALAAHRETERAGTVLTMIDSYLAPVPEAAPDAPEDGYVDAWDAPVALPEHPPIEPDDGRDPVGTELEAAIHALERDEQAREDASLARRIENKKKYNLPAKVPERKVVAFADDVLAKLRDGSKTDRRHSIGVPYDALERFDALLAPALADFPMARVVEFALAGSYGGVNSVACGRHGVFALHVADALGEGRIGLQDLLRYAVERRPAKAADRVPFDQAMAEAELGFVRQLLSVDRYHRASIPPFAWQVVHKHLDTVAACLPPREADAKKTLRALEVIAAFPSLPKALVGALLDTALDARPRVARVAQAMLKDVPGIDATLAERLSDKQLAQRAAAARMLAARGATGTVPALEARLKKERTEVARGEMIAALAELGDASAYLSPAALTEEAERLAAKMPEPPLDPVAAPALTWADGSPVARIVPDAWMRLAVKLKTPLGVPLLSVWMAQLSPESARRLSGWVLDAWLSDGFERVDPEEARERAQEMLPDVLKYGRQYGMPPYSEMVEGRSDAEVLEHLAAREAAKPAVKLTDAKGLLALAGHADGPAFGPRLGAWLKKNGGDQNAAKALVDACHLMGTREAVQVLVSVATRFRQKTVRALAEARLAELAEARGWTEDELADRAVSDAGFDAEGRMALPLDAETVYVAVLQDDLTVKLTSPAGKVVKALPARADEAGKAAKAALSATRKALKDTAKLQSGRLRDAMLVGRAWDAEAWRQDVAGHVLLRRLAQRLVWRALDAEGGVRATFRPTQEGEIVDAAGDPVELAGAARIDLAHASILSEDDRAAWVEHLSDFEVAPCFEQLTRPVMRLPEGSAPTRIEDRHGWRTTTFALRGAAGKRGYERGAIEDGGGFSRYERSFPGAGLVAQLHFEGSGVNEVDEPTTLEHMAFVRTDGSGRAVPLERIPEVLLSEVWCDLHDIAKVAEPPEEEPRG